MLDYGSKMANEQYYYGVIVGKDDSHENIPYDEVVKYIEILEKCPIICDNLVVQMHLTKHCNNVGFNGLVAYNLKQGGFSTYGIIDLDKELVNMYISLKNDDKYDKYVVKMNEINKGKVK